MKQWRELGIFVTTKAHILESLGYKAKDVIKQGHQKGVADGHQLKHVKNDAKKQSSSRKTSQLTNHLDVFPMKEDLAQ